MDAAAARDWLTTNLGVSRETIGRIEAFVEELRLENDRQNLVSRQSLNEVWHRHIVDSAQLLRFAPSGGLRWLDLGSGPGLPGLVLAIITGKPTTLIESRRLRSDFLLRVTERLGLTNVIVAGNQVEREPSAPFDVITARAFAPLERLLSLAHRFSTDKSVWILPKGRNAKSELEAVQPSWQGRFRIEPSITDAEAGIIVAQGVQPAGKGHRA